ncbi:MAG: DNA recombination protein RmuC [Chitinophagales bacterium]
MNEVFIYIIVAVIFMVFGYFISSIFSKLKFEKQQAQITERNQQLQFQLEEVKKISTLQIDDLKTNQQQYLEEYKLSTREEKSRFEKRIGELNEQLYFLRNEKEALQIKLTQKESDFKNSVEKLRNNKDEIENLQEKFTKEFENLANKILEDKSKKFTEQNQVNIEQILNPLQEKINTFEQKVDNTNKENIARHAALGQHLKSLHEQNVKISLEANNLAKALKGENKTQGNWGELILERVLEKSGLEKGREYEMEKSFAVNNGNKQRLRPDVIVHLPDNKKMVVDSKVSLTAYEKYVNSDDETEKESFLKEHIASLNRHVSQLSEKKYEDLYEIESPDFVLLFVPVEPAFAVAINNDNQLYNKAFEKNIVIVTPATLLATLRTIDSMWNNEKQQRNALEIARQAGALYDKFEGLYSDLIKIGSKMDSAKNDYDDAINKLKTGRGNLINSVEKIKKLGAKAKKSLPESIIQKAEDSNEFENKNKI